MRFWLSRLQHLSVGPIYHSLQLYIHLHAYHIQSLRFYHRVLCPFKLFCAPIPFFTATSLSSCQLPCLSLPIDSQLVPLTTVEHYIEYGIYCRVLILSNSFWRIEYRANGFEKTIIILYVKFIISSYRVCIPSGTSFDGTDHYFPIHVFSQNNKYMHPNLW